MLKLNLLQNALHTLHHAVEHLQWSEEETPVRNGRVFDVEDGSISWKNDKGQLCFQVPEFTRMPSGCNLKFSLLHLIQASELLLKAYVERCDPASLFIARDATKTINLQQALHFATQRHPDLFTPAQRALLLEAKRLRNAIEHYRFEMTEDRLRAICVDFLAICMLVSQTLLSTNIADVFSWDYLNDTHDRVAGYLESVLTDITEIGRGAVKRTGHHWASVNTLQTVFLCLKCGARAVRSDRGVCMGCGTYGDEELIEILEEWRTAEMKLAELQRRLSDRSVALEQSTTYHPDKS